MYILYNIEMKYHDQTMYTKFYSNLLFCKFLTINYIYTCILTAIERNSHFQNLELRNLTVTEIRFLGIDKPQFS